MKTNHRRGFVAKSPSTLKVRYGYGAYAQCQLDTERIVCSKYFGFVHDRANRKDKAGGKKFVRSRVRFHDNKVARQLAKEFEF